MIDLYLLWNSVYYKKVNMGELGECWDLSDREDGNGNRAIYKVENCTIDEAIEMFKATTDPDEGRGTITLYNIMQKRLKNGKSKI